MPTFSVGSCGSKGSKNGEIVVGCCDAIGFGTPNSLGTELGTKDSSSLGTVDGAMDRASLGIVDGTKDELGTRVELGLDESASTSAVVDNGERDSGGDTARRWLLLL